jgi:hypothetical protein
VTAGADLPGLHPAQNLRTTPRFSLARDGDGYMICIQLSMSSQNGIERQPKHGNEELHERGDRTMGGNGATRSCRTKPFSHQSTGWHSVLREESKNKTQFGRHGEAGWVTTNYSSWVAALWLMSRPPQARNKPELRQNGRFGQARCVGPGACQRSKLPRFKPPIRSPRAAFASLAILASDSWDVDVVVTAAFSRYWAFIGGVGGL